MSVRKEKKRMKTIGQVVLMPTLLVLMIFPLLACGIFYTAAHHYAMREASDRLTELREAVLPKMEEVFQKDSGEEPKVMVGSFVRQVAPVVRRMEGDTRLLIFAAENHVVYPRDEEERRELEPVTEAFATYIGAHEEELSGQENATLSNGKALRIRTAQGEEFLASIYPSPISSLQLRYIITYCPVAKINAWVLPASVLVLFISTSSAVVLIWILHHIARTMTQQFEALASEAERIGSGDFSRIERDFSIDEAVTLEKSMNRMADTLRASRESEQKFYQNVSHDLRTPLMSIGGYAQGIETGVLKDAVHAAHIISEESTRLTNYVRDLLTLSRLENGEQFHLEKVDLADVIEESLAHMSGFALQKNVELSVEMPVREWIVEADSDQLVRILDNLLSNAVRYARSRVWIEVRAKEESTDIRVLDDGEGISEQDLPRIFERSYKGAQGGFGFGLAIASNAARNMHAVLHAENRKEGGACFTLSFACSRNVP